MTTTQVIKTAQVATTSTWSSIFPEKQSTIEESALFVKKLLAVGLSSITYLRSIFPENAYDDRDLDGLKLKMLLDDSDCYGAAKLVTWMKSAFQAIDKQYLRQLTFAMHTDPEDPENSIESYTYKVSYNNNVASISEFSTRVSSIEKKFDVKKSTQKMLRTVLLLTQSLNPLPSKVFLTMKIKYYDEKTPSDYEPSGFMAAPPAAHSSCSNDPVTIKVGDVSTFYHTVKLRVTVDKAIYWDKSDIAEEEKQLESYTPRKPELECNYSDVNKQQDIEDPLPSSEPVIVRSTAKNSFLASFGGKGSSTISASMLTEQHSAINEEDRKNFEENLPTPPIAVSQSSSLEDYVPSITPLHKVHPVKHLANASNVKEAQVVPVDNQCESSQSQKHPSGHTIVENDTFVSSGTDAKVDTSSTMEEEEDGEEPVKCQCGVQKDDGLMILCDICKTWQHALCYKVLKKEEVPSEHRCLECAFTKGLQCSDTTLENMNKEKVQETCLVRRTFEFLRSYQGRITIAKIQQRLGVDIREAQLVMDSLNSKSVFLHRGKGRGRLVNQKKILEHWAHYFDSLPDESKEVEEIEHTPKLEHQDYWDSDMTPDLQLPSTAIDSEMESIQNTPTAKSEANTQTVADRVSQKTTQKLQESQLQVSCMSDSHQGLMVDSTQDVPIGSQRHISLGNGLDSSVSDFGTEHFSQALATGGNTLTSLVDTEPLDYSTIPTGTATVIVKTSTLKEVSTKGGSSTYLNEKKNAVEGDILTVADDQVSCDTMKVDPEVFGFKLAEYENTKEKREKVLVEAVSEVTSGTIGVEVEDQMKRRALMTRSSRLSRDKNKQPVTMSLSDFEISSSQGSATPDLRGRKKRKFCI